MVDHVGRIFRPPSEARSFLLQVTVGCSHNRCSYCDMYRDKQFKPKPWPTIEQDLREAARHGARGLRSDKVFLCDGDALILSTKRLLEILAGIRTHLPWVTRVGTYGDTRSVGNKSVEELRALREAGLGIVYHGMESGSDEVLARIDKGGTRAELIATADKLRAADLVHSVIVLLGIGGEALSERHAHETASALSRMDPPYVGALTTTVLPGTPLFEQQARGEFARLVNLDRGQQRLLIALRGVERVVRDGFGDAAGQGAHGGVAEKDFRFRDGKFVAAQIFVGMEFSDGHFAFMLMASLICRK